MTNTEDIIELFNRKKEKRYGEGFGIGRFEDVLLKYGRIYSIGVGTGAWREDGITYDVEMVFDEFSSETPEKIQDDLQKIGYVASVFNMTVHQEPPSPRYFKPTGRRYFTAELRIMEIVPPPTLDVSDVASVLEIMRTDGWFEGDTLFVHPRQMSELEKEQEDLKRQLAEVARTEYLKKKKQLDEKSNLNSERLRKLFVK